MRSKSRFTTLVLLETRESYLQIRVQSQDTRTLRTSSKCHLRSAASLNRPIALDGGYHSSCLGARNVPLGSKAALGGMVASDIWRLARSGNSQCRRPERTNRHSRLFFARQFRKHASTKRPTRVSSICSSDFGISRQHRDAEQRCRSAGRPAE